MQEWLQSHGSDGEHNSDQAPLSDFDSNDSSLEFESDEGERDLFTARTPKPAATIEEFYAENIALDEDAAVSLEQVTRSQSESTDWFAARRLRITATSSKAIVCRQKTDVSNLVQWMLHGSFRGNEATRYGNEHEESAINDYIISQTTSESVVTVARSGLIVRPDEPWLACSPDGLISNSSTPDKGLLEVKCPFRCSSMSFEEAAKSASFCLKREKDSFPLLQSHSYFYQIEHSLLVTRLR